MIFVHLFLLVHLVIKNLIIHQHCIDRQHKKNELALVERQKTKWNNYLYVYTIFYILYTYILENRTEEDQTIEFTRVLLVSFFLFCLNTSNYHKHPSTKIYHKYNFRKYSKHNILQTSIMFSNSILCDYYYIYHVVLLLTWQVYRTPRLGLIVPCTLITITHAGVIVAYAHTYTRGYIK